ncbi:nicotinate (nicotinamide) nucleotide adenylyltransferase [bacterium]|nr:nicotinate (nicotinamide) nucleotide adenylyltransferase [bacterium]
MAICIFPGTFNPIHQAHLSMAEFALKNYSFEKIIFIPSYIPPHKNIDKNLAAHRYNMVKLAIAYNKKFEIADIEYKSEGKSYSLITVQKIIEEYQVKEKLNFIIGADAFKEIKTWFRSDELSKLVHFIVFPRDGFIINDEDYKNYSYEIANMPSIKLSSTELRTKHGIGTDKKIEEYIKANDLYN